MPEEDFPVHDTLDVIEGETVFKTDEWWKAAVVYERYGRKIGIYLWNWREDEDRWVRKQKYVIKSVEDWETERKVVDSFLPILKGDESPSDSGTDGTKRSGSGDSSSADGPNVDDLLGDLMDLSEEDNQPSPQSSTSEEDEAPGHVDCPVPDCPYTGSPRSVAGHVSGKPDDQHQWEALGFEGAVEFRRKFADS